MSQPGAPRVGSERPIRILHVLSAGTAGGAEHHVLRLLGGLDRTRFEPWLTVFESEPDTARSLLDDFRASGVRVVELAQRGRLSARAQLRFRALLHSGRFGLIHTHSLRADLATTFWTRTLRARPKLVRSVHNTDPHFNHPILGRLARLATSQLDAIIVISDAVGRFLQSAIALPPERMTRIYYGFTPTEHVTAAAPSPGGERRLLVAARLAPQKGQDVLIAALPPLVQEFPDLQVWFAGHETGSSATALQHLASRLGVGHAVRFLGFRADVAQLMRDSEIVVLPSFWEGFGLVLLEAMDAARPIVASAVGAIPEVVEHDRGGLLVPPGDPRALGAALAALLRDPLRAASMGQAGRVRLVERFGERAMIEATESLYNTLLGRAASASGSPVGRESPARSERLDESFVD